MNCALHTFPKSPKIFHSSHPWLFKSTWRSLEFKVPAKKYMKSQAWLDRKFSIVLAGNLNSKNSHVLLKSQGWFDGNFFGIVRKFNFFSSLDCPNFQFSTLIDYSGILTNCASSVFSFKKWPQLSCISFSASLSSCWTQHLPSPAPCFMQASTLTSPSIALGIIIPHINKKNRNLVITNIA